VFGKVVRCAFEEVIVELLKMKCLPVLFYGLESCPLIESHVNFLDFAISSTFTKILGPLILDPPICYRIACSPAPSLWLRVTVIRRCSHLVHVLMIHASPAQCD